MADLVLGVDGGGSKTRALIADASGAVLGAGVGASSNYQSVGFDSAAAALHTAIAAARAAAGLDESAHFAAVCFGLAGVDRPADQTLFDGWIRRERIAPRHRVVNDAELVLAGGSPDGWGVALICGTGSIAFGRAADGRTARAGGWGHLIGDEGSGYDIAVQALRLATQTADGRAAAHGVLGAILGAWQLTVPEQLIDRCYRPETTRAVIASLAPVVVALAESGDAAALGVLDRAAAELGKQIGAVVRQLDLVRPPLAFGGGLVGGHRWLQERIVAAAQTPLGPAEHVADPAQGALRIARRLLETETQSTRSE